MIFHRTSQKTDGRAVLVETIVQPHGFVAAAHVHPYQSERFEVLEGALGLRGGDDELIARPGETVTVPSGTPHRFHNPGDREVRFLCEVHPALGFESLIETMFTLATDGKTNRNGMPNPPRGHRQGALRDRAAPAGAGFRATRGAGDRRPARSTRWLPGDIWRPRAQDRARSGVNHR